ncbi:hypothetical protein D9601_00065 [Sphingomonas sp. MA1305]|uniref:hypothetical protein n=1 Tax=Sphingomonas sp. MA1305 TaxID=2479204 RepID=UPI0018DFCFF0|nr:hypothetical protein [Sphingomonas sp. MA1305]MBI0473756.1 hypothetical protein [Sphingomonas sp. MA1305]
MIRPGTLPWLIGHEVRLAWRGRPRGWGSALILGVLLGLYILGGIALAIGLRDTPIAPRPWLAVPLFGMTLLVTSLMTTQAMIASQQTLYGARDLDLLLTAPLPPRAAILAKLLGIAASVVTVYAALLLPIVLPVATLGHPRLFGTAALLIALALAAAATGLALTLLIAAVAGPRAARTVGQIAAAVLGGAFFLATQIASHSGSGTRRSLFAWFAEHGIGRAGWSLLPLRAAFGDGTALSLIGLVSIALFVAVGVVLERRFLSTYVDGGMRLSRHRVRSRGLAGLFHASLRRTVFAKEWRLLARDPALLAQIVLRLVYLLPLVLVGMQHRGGDGSFAPPLAAAGVLIASQLAGSLAWLTLSAEDAPELLAVAPVATGVVRRAKLTAALAMAAPFALLPALVVAASTLAGALVTLAMAALAGLGTGGIEMLFGKPGNRAGFARRQKGSVAAGLLSLFVAAICGGIAALAVYWLIR